MKNDTIKKLDRYEIAECNLLSMGIYTFKGEVKKIIRGMKRTMNTPTEIHFENENTRFEIISIIPTEDEPEWAIRMFDKEKNKYKEFWQVLWGLNFIK